MEIEKCTYKTKCDFHGCDKLAEYSLSTKGFVKRDLNFCSTCLSQMYDAIGRVKIPKGTNSPFKLNKKLKRGENER